jgi:general secretion pathway protein D
VVSGEAAAAVAQAPVAPPAPTAPQGAAPADNSPAAQAANYANQTAAAIKNAGSDGSAGGATGGAASQSAPVPAAPASGGDQKTPYSINRQAGILSVYGTAKQQALIKAYLDKVIAKIGTQVLIEAKVVEIALNDQYNTGVDWQALRQNLKGTGFGVSTLTPSTNAASAIPNLPTPGSLSSPFGTFGLNAGFTTFGGDLAAMINLVKSYGDVRTLSSPRLTVMNNEPATLKVAQNHVYFKLQATVTSTPASAGSVASQTATYTSQLQTLPIGLVMTVQPSIDADKGLVTLGLHPSVTAWPGSTVSDPAVALSIASACGAATTGACSATNVANAVAAASVPVVDVREMESIVTVPSGSVVVLGGLMQQVNSKNDSGIPGASDVPVVGNLFKANSDSLQLTELVVFLKATLVHGPDSVDWADKDTYQNYVHDPRPLNF